MEKIMKIMKILLKKVKKIKVKPKFGLFLKIVGVIGCILLGIYLFSIKFFIQKRSVLFENTNNSIHESLYNQLNKKLLQFYMNKLIYYFFIFW